MVFGWASGAKNVTILVLSSGFASRLQREVENLVSRPAAQLAAVQPEQKRSFLTIVNHTLKSRIRKKGRKEALQDYFGYVRLQLNCCMT